MNFLTKHTWFISVFLLSSCIEPISLQSDKNPEVSDCQSCHFSPPPTGEHELHLFKQLNHTARPITCQDCHASSIEKMIWQYSVRKNPNRDLHGWQTIVNDAVKQTYQISWPNEIISEYSTCTTLHSGNQLFTAVRDSFFQFSLLVSPGDSIFRGDTAIWIFPFDAANSTTRIDTIPADLFLPERLDTVIVSQFFEPTSYNSCQYHVKGDSLFLTQTGAFNALLLTLQPSDIVFDNDNIHKIIVLSQDPVNFQIELFGLIAARSTFLLEYSGGDFENYITVNNNGEGNVLFKLDTLYDENNPAVINNIDSAFYQFVNDSLYKLLPDSSISYDKRIFATNTAHHNNGKIDVNFYSPDTFSLYFAETLKVFLDPVTQDTIATTVRHRGAWDPKKLQCWSDETISAMQCHDRQNGWTKWYR